MANPQLEKGYLRIANELHERLLQAKLSSNELRLMLLAIRLTYGKQRKTTDELKSKSIGDHLDIHEGAARKVLNRLEERRFIVCVSQGWGNRPGVYRVEKNWETWDHKRTSPWPELISISGVNSGSNGAKHVTNSGSGGAKFGIKRRVIPDQTARNLGSNGAKHDRETRTSIEPDGPPKTIRHEDMKTPPYPQGETGESGGDFSADQTTGNQGHNSPSRPPEKKLAQALQAITGCKPKPVDLRRVREILSKTTPAGWDAKSWRRNVSRTWDSILREVVAEVAQGSRLGSVIGVACARTETALGVAAKLPKQEEH